MKICMISGTFPPVRDGVADYTFQLVQALANLPYTRLSVLTSTQADSHTGQNFETLPMVQGWNWTGVRQVLAWLRQNRPDIVHFQYPTQLYGRHPAITLLPFLVWLQATLGGQRAPQQVLTIHEYGSFRRLGKIRIWLMSLFCQKIVTVSLETGRALRLLKFLGKKFYYVPISSNISTAPPPAYQQDPARWRTKHVLAAAKPVLVYFGYVSPSKGLPVLLKAFASLTQKRDCQLVLVADPHALDASYQVYFDQVDALIHRLELTTKIHWTGFAPDPDVAAYLQSATLVVLPFLDGASLRRTSLFAALANGAAILTTYPTSRDEAPGLIMGENVWFVPPDQPTALLTALEKLLDDASLRAHLGQNARQFAARFSWPAIAHQHLGLYND